ncbi:MAG: type I methionyl aminopeptidase [Bacteroidetes bacterium]|nr:type I methionyl aminopeptidase [Bacteroidota bacterium]
MAVNLKSKEEIELIKISSLLVGETLAMLASELKPGISTLKLDTMANDFIRSHGAVPTFMGYHGYKYNTCISVNEEVVHGLPSNREVKDGDLVSIDIGVTKNGWIGDSAYSFGIGEVSAEKLKLMEVTYQCLYLGIAQALIGKRVGDISSAVQVFAEKNGYGVVRELVGHGVGKMLHEKPEVPNYGTRGNGPLLKEGMVIAIEPMINAGKRQVSQLNDKWTIVTADRKPSAHYEHTVAIVDKNQPLILSSFELIEGAIANNRELTHFKQVIEKIG